MIRRRNPKHVSDLSQLPAESQVVQACKQLMRRIHEKGLKVGDQLETQEELCRLLGMGGETVTLAMGALVEAGVLTRRRRVGTLIADVAGWVPGVWTVGIASILVSGQGSGSFFSDLTHRLQSHLRLGGCRVQSYIRAVETGQSPPTVMHYEDALRDLEQGRIDTLVTPTLVSMEMLHLRPKFKKLPVIHVGFQENAPLAVVIDEERFTYDATTALMVRGCRRIGFVTHGPRPSVSSNSFWKGFDRAVAEGGAGYTTKEFAAGFGLPGGVRATEELLAVAPENRPDGLVVTDDWIAMGLVSSLRNKAPDYRPLLSVQTNKQVPLAFALPVIRFDVDVDELAQRGVELTINCLRKPGTTGQIIRVPAQRVSERETEIPQYV